MAHNNLFHYGLGTYGKSTCCNGSVASQNCEDDMYGCCTTPAGPNFANLGYNRPIDNIIALSPEQKMSIIKANAMRRTTAPNPPRPNPPHNPPHNYGPYYIGEDHVGVL